MDSERRRQVRSARARRHTSQPSGGIPGAPNGVSATTSNAGGSAPPTPPPRNGSGTANNITAGGTAAGATAAPSGRRRATFASRDEAQRLSQRMQQQRQDKTRAGQLLSQREATIHERYAPGTAPMQLPRGATPQQVQQAAAAAAAASAGFDKDELLATLIGDNKANFLKLDHDLTEDHVIATQRLHNSVFGHANSFLLLFRDVDRASDLVEALKANVQGTKAAISSISKYSSTSIIVGSSSTLIGKSASGADARGSVFSSALSSSLGEGDPRRLARPSLVSRRIKQRFTSGNGDVIGEEAWMNGAESSTTATSAASPGSAAPAVSATPSALNRGTTWSATAQQGGNVAGGTTPGDEATAAAAAGGGGGGGDGGGSGASADTAGNTGASRPTTRALNGSSVRQWRYTIGLGSASPATTAAAVAAASGGDNSSGGGRRVRGALAGDTTGASASGSGGAAKAEKEAIETLSFVDIVREEVSQLLTERRHVDAAELLYRLADDATKRGCLPFLLDQEAALVRSVITNVVRIPVTPMFVESLHVPLVQLLLRFGRSRSAAAVYLGMQTPWLHSEVQKLQARVNPQYASLIAVDYLVRVTRATVRRQHTLGLTLAAAQPMMGDAIAASSNPNSAAAENGKEDAKRGATTGAGGRGAAQKRGAANAAPAGTLIPPNSAALLWVRRNVERFSSNVLATHLLGFGAGTDGGDPSRIRQAAQMISQTSRVMQTLSADGFAGCDTLILRQLTPSLVVLEDDFTRLTGERIEHGSRAMMEQLIMGSLMFFETNDANTAAVHNAAAALASYASAMATVPLSAGGGGAAGGPSSVEEAKRTGKDGAAAAVPQLPPRPAPPKLTPPYVPSKCDDVARKVRGLCQELVQVLRTFSLSGHSLLLQLALAPATSSLFVSSGSAASPSGSVTPRKTQNSVASAIKGGRGGGGLQFFGKASSPSATSLGLNNLLFAAVPPLPPLPTELFRFLRYANGCSSTQVRLLQSLCGYIAALTGTAMLPAEVMAAAAAQEQESANSTAAAAIRAQQAECVAYLLTSAMVTESIDVVLSNLFTAMMLGLLRQRRALVRFLSSDAFLKHHRRTFPALTGDKAAAAADAPFFSDPANAPAWVLDGTLCLLSDVVSTGIWISYFTRGGAMAHMLADAAFGFRTQYLEKVERDVPRLVQGWMCAAVLLSIDVTHANTVLAPPKRNPTASPTTSRTSAAPPASSPLLAPQQSVLFGTRNPESRTTPRPSGVSSFSSNANLASPRQSNMSFTAVAAAATAAAQTTTLANPIKKSSKEGVDAASVLLSIPVTNGSGAAAASTAPAPLGPGMTVGTGSAATSFFADAGVREERLLKVIMTFLDRKFRTPSTYTVHRYVIDSTNASDGAAAAAAGVPAGVWAVRKRLSSYPEFPIGDMWDHRTDEVYLFHWCAQVSLHLLTLFQERLVTPSAMMNQAAAEAQGGAAALMLSGKPFPIDGCITPQEETVLAGWCAGGGNYVTAVALLQFLVMRLLRDGLCRPETWTAVYGCPTARWRADETVLRQQLFFFSLFMHLWAPLFTGGRTPRPRSTANAAGATRTTASAAAAANSEETPVSSYLVDGLPPLAVLEWMTCGGILSPGAPPNFVDTAMTAAPPGTIPLSLTAVDVLFVTEGTIRLSNLSNDRAESGGSGTGGGKAGGGGGGAGSWKAKAGGSNVGATTASDSGAPFASSGASTYTMLAKRELFGAGASFIPDSLLRVVRHFFEEQLGESRAIPAITSETMRNRVARAMVEINLVDFVGTSLGGDDDSEDDTASVKSSSSATSGSSSPRQPAPQKVTLQHLRDLIAVYTKPVR